MTCKRRRTAAMLVAALLSSTIAAPGAAAQQLPASALGLANDPGATGAVPSSSRVRVALDRLPAWSAPIASLVVPGLGQARLGRNRFVGYMAAEGFFLLKYAADSREAARSDRLYRQIARDVARRGFVANPPDTLFQYYEKLSSPLFLESGVFTLSTSGATIPEPDSTTFNGNVWAEQRRLYGVAVGDRSSAAYRLALAGYERLAVRQEYRWSWRNAQLEKDIFTRAIERHDDASRRVSSDVAVLIANHLLSAVDAFAVFRLQQLRSGGVVATAAVPIRWTGARR